MKRQTTVVGLVAVWAAAGMVGAPNVPAADKAVAPPAPVARTGITISITNGDDGAYQAGLSLPEPRFTVEGDVVTDNLTGLMWPKDLGVGGQKNWADALAFCKQLDLGGHKDWRLANVRELQSLNGWADKAMVPKGHPFTNVPVLLAWTSTTFAPDANVAWYMRQDCYMGHDVKTAGQANVIPVRGGIDKQGKVITKGLAPVAKTGQTKSYAPGDDGDLQFGLPLPSPRFTVEKSGDCVTDSLTGLMWTKSGNIAGGAGNMSWYEARDLCEKLELGGYSDWRLPNEKELQSLVDFSSGMPGEPFVDTLRTGGMVAYWSGTYIPEAAGTPVSSAWFVTGEGYVSGNAMDGSRYKHRPWPVRGGTLNPVKAAQAKEVEKK